MTNKASIGPADLKAHLDEPLGFLERSADAFDRGFSDEAKRLAVTVRVLVHDTSVSHSLLGQLAKLDGRDFLDSASPDIPGNIATYSGLIGVAVNAQGGRYLPLLDDVPIPARWVPFSKWWNAIVFRDGKGLSTSRKQLILSAANQDGGAHVDPSLNFAYAQLSKNNSLNWFSGTSAGDVPIQNPERAAIRQVAHEVLKTLRPGYKKKTDFPGPSISNLQVSAKIESYDQPPRKMKRNEPCYCGSGKKYKHCHGKLS